MSIIKSEVYFTTGDFAKLCEVTKQTLFHYDQIGLLHPDHKDDKGYRYYSYTQYDTMYVIESLKEMEMPLREIKEFISVTTPDKMIELFKEKSRQISEKINNLASIQNTIEKKILITEQAMKTDFREIVLTEASEEYLYLSASLLNNNDDENKDAISDFYKVCMRELHEKYSIGVMINIDDITDGEFENFEHLFAKTDYTEAMPLVKNNKTMQVIGYHTGKYENVAETYDTMFNFIEVNHLTPVDYLYAEPILDRISVNDSDKYVTQITIPVTRR